MLIDITAKGEKSHLKKMRIGYQKHEDASLRLWMKGKG